MSTALAAIAINPSYISKSGKYTPGLSYFWSGCASAMKRGREILGIALVDANSNDTYFLEAIQTLVEPVRGRKPKCTHGMKDPDSLIDLYLRALAKRASTLPSEKQGGLGLRIQHVPYINQRGS